MRRLVLEEYGPELRYIKGEHNIVADALSRLDLDDSIPLADIKESSMAECFNGEGGRISFRGIPSPYEYTQSCSIQRRSFEKLVKDNPLYSEGD
jgi:hypothetical protein